MSPDGLAGHASELIGKELVLDTKRLLVGAHVRGVESLFFFPPSVRGAVDLHRRLEEVYTATFQDAYIAGDTWSRYESSQFGGSRELRRGRCLTHLARHLKDRSAAEEARSALTRTPPRQLHGITCARRTAALAQRGGRGLGELPPPALGEALEVRVRQQLIDTALRVVAAWRGGDEVARAAARRGRSTRAAGDKVSRGGPAMMKLDARATAPAVTRSLVDNHSPSVADLR